MASGAKYWQEHWEINTEKSEKQMLIEVAKQTRMYRKNRSSYIQSTNYEKLQNRNTIVRLFNGRTNHDDIKKSIISSRPYAVITNKLILGGYSASRTQIYVGIYLTLIWGILLISTLDLSTFVIGDIKISGFKD